MINRIKSKRIVLFDSVVSGYVYFENAKIVAVTADELPFDTEIDVGDKYVAPGFIDMHTHGGGGHDFLCSVDDVVEGCNFHLSHGATSICPTLTSSPFEKMADGVRYVEAAMIDPRTRPNIIGAHLEGPYLSFKQSGAQSAGCITPPIAKDYEPLIEQHGKAIARWTYAPENDEGGAFCKYLSEHGIVPSLGHTDATYGDVLTAIENGCTSVTHLYSCTSTITRDHGYRVLGVTESALLFDELCAELICDGRHLPPELIRLAVKTKGVDNVMAVTDSLAIVGTDIKHGWLVDTEFVIEDGVCRLMDRSAFAGSIATADRCVRVLTSDVGLTFPEAVRMISAVPARVLGVNKGELARGKAADIVVFDSDVNISHIWVMGERVK